jgi:hypothetical protein
VSVTFPELNSYGTLVSFALSLEQVAEARAIAAGDERVARKHQKRARQLEQIFRERLNEVVLQPLSGLDRTAYLPADELDLAALEALIARFYDDAATVAAEVLIGVDRTFRKWAEESRGF